MLEELFLGYKEMSTRQIRGETLTRLEIELCKKKDELKMMRQQARALSASIRRMEEHKCNRLKRLRLYNV